MADVPVSGRSTAVAPSERPGEPGGLGKTQRTDPWWVEWISVSGGLLFLGSMLRGPRFKSPLT